MNDAEKPNHSALQHEAEHAKPGKRVSVLVYLVILFAAAFLLLLLSYLMQQRSSADAINSMKETVSAVQSIENLVDAKDALEKQVDALEKQTADLKTQLESQLAQMTAAEQSAQEAEVTLSRQLAAMDWLAELQELYGKQYYKAARAMITEFEAAGQRALLPTRPLHTYDGSETPSPAQRYQEIYDILFPPA